MVGFPLLLIPLAVFNIIVFLMPGVALSTTLVTITLMSGVAWPVTLADVLLALGILLLLLEVMKGARPGAKFFTDHLLSLIVFGAAAAEFVMLPQFGNSTYLLLTLLAFVDFVSGIALRTRRRRAVVSAPLPEPVVPPAAEPRPVVQEPRFEPTPVPAVPTAAPVAESILKSAPEPVVVSPPNAPSSDTGSSNPSPGVSAPIPSDPPKTN